MYMRNEKGQFIKGEYQGYGFKKGVDQGFGFKKGNEPWNRGKTWSSEVREKMSQARKGTQTNEEHHAWKGNKVCYAALHSWVVRKLGRPTECEWCGKNEHRKHYIQWANIDHEYKRDLNDWVRLCAKCHRTYDKLNGLTTRF